MIAEANHHIISIETHRLARHLKVTESLTCCVFMSSPTGMATIVDSKMTIKILSALYCELLSRIIFWFNINKSFRWEYDR